MTGKTHDSDYFRQRAAEARASARVARAAAKKQRSLASSPLPMPRWPAAAPRRTPRRIIAEVPAEIA